MSTNKKIEWLLRVSLFGTFVGHGMFALGGKASWALWISGFTGADPVLASQLLLLVGMTDILVGIILLVLPLRIVILWAIVWTSWTAIMHILPVIGDPIWELFEKVINPLASVSLLLLRGVPTTFKGWLK